MLGISLQSLTLLGRGEDVASGTNVCLAFFSAAIGLRYGLLVFLIVQGQIEPQISAWEGVVLNLLWLGSLQIL